MWCIYVFMLGTVWLSRAIQHARDSVPTRSGGKGRTGRNYLGPAVQKAAQGPPMLHLFLPPLQYHYLSADKLTLSDQAQITRKWESYFAIYCENFYSFMLNRGPGNFFFKGLELLSAALERFSGKADCGNYGSDLIYESCSSTASFFQWFNRSQLATSSPLSGLHHHTQTHHFQ